MQLALLTITATEKHKQTGANGLAAEYLRRIERYVPCQSLTFPAEFKMQAFLQKIEGRTRPALVLTDSRGQQVSSPELAEAVRQFRDSGRQQLVFAVGPADGWSDTMRARADLTIAFGRITLPHELAAVVLAEQVYRAMTILAGHPYHTGH